MEERELPAGLEWCADCGEVRGEILAERDDGALVLLRSACLCDGLVCRVCGRRAIRRPISDYYNPEDGEWWHVPHFAALDGRCRDCRVRSGR